MVKKRAGKVYIVGAGPGDPELATIKCLDYIKKADVIVYDRLIPKSLLKYRKKSSVLKYVGKAKSKHFVPQQEINAILLKSANEYNFVLRLKGGDPFIFGRGAEEVLFLNQYGIPYEVVPGVSSCYAIPELSGIPVTHRGLASGFLVVTGHEDINKVKSHVDWPYIAKFKGTLAILMGKSNLPTITKTLLSNGMKKTTPCAVISNGANKKQRIITAPLSEIAQRSKMLTAPTVIVMGAVVSLQHEIMTIQKPLKNKRFLITASRTLNKIMAKDLKKLGANTDTVPVIKITPNEDNSELKTVIKNIRQFKWLVFTSRHGVIHFLKQYYQSGKKNKDLAGKIACVGSGTASEFLKNRLNPSLMPKEFTTQHLAKELLGNGVKGQKVALLRTTLSEDPLKDTLIRAGADITNCIVYFIEKSSNNQEIIKAISKNPNGILFLSPASVNRFFEIVSFDMKKKLKQQTSFISIGPVTTEALKHRGINRVFEPTEYTAKGLINLCVEIENNSERKK